MAHYPSLSLSLYLSISLSLYLSISLSISLSIYIYIYMYDIKCLYIYICVVTPLATFITTLAQFASSQAVDAALDPNFCNPSRTIR